MRVALHFVPNQIDEMSLRDGTVVIVDVLRACTSIATALSNGAKEIIPATTVEQAVKISGNLFGDVILRGGERNGKMIEGFNLGNSPSEYSEEKVKGKSIIFSSSNGSQAMGKARYARDMLICGFVNISAVAACLREANRDFTIVCAGNNGMFSIEDSVCAGMLIQKLVDSKSPDLVLSDAALAAVTLYKSFGRGILKMIKNSEHGRYLTEIGFGADLETCADVDSLPVLPRSVGNVIRVKPVNSKKPASDVRPA
jgi:2-phosphosulfolactate phosphatase